MSALYFRDSPVCGKQILITYEWIIVRHDQAAIQQFSVILGLNTFPILTVEQIRMLFGDN